MIEIFLPKIQFSRLASVWDQSGEAIIRRTEISMLRLSLFALCLIVCAVPTHAQNIPASEASKHVGEQATVCGKIVSRHTAENAHGKPTFIDLGAAFPHQAFTTVIWEDDKNKVGDFPSSGSVCVTGKIAEYKGVPQIVLHDAKSWFASPATATK
jgi:hypothetical protein